MFIPFFLAVWASQGSNPDAVMKANQEVGMKLVASTGLEIKDLPDGTHTIKSNRVDFSYRVIAATSDPKAIDFALLELTRHYRSAGRVSVQALDDACRSF